MRTENGTTLIHFVTKNIMRMGNSTNITHSCYSFKIVMSWFISHTQEEKYGRRVAMLNVVNLNSVHIVIYAILIRKNETLFRNDLLNCYNFTISICEHFFSTAYVEGCIMSILTNKAQNLLTHIYLQKSIAIKNKNTEEQICVFHDTHY